MLYNIIQSLKARRRFKKKDLAYKIKAMKKYVEELELEISKLAFEAEEREERFARERAELHGAIEKKDALIASQYKRISDLTSSGVTPRNTARRQKPSREEVVSHLRQTRNMRLPRKGASLVRTMDDAWKPKWYFRLGNRS